MHSLPLRGRGRRERKNINFEQNVSFMAQFISKYVAAEMFGGHLHGL